MIQLDSMKPQSFKLLKKHLPKSFKRGCLLIMGMHKTLGQKIKQSYLIYRPALAHDYQKMQKTAYDNYAMLSRVEPGNLLEDHVVGSWLLQNSWEDYETFLMKYIPVNSGLIALDFGCGPGRNISKWQNRFNRIDGADISKENLKNAEVFLKNQIEESKMPRFFETSGMDCGEINDDTYDFIFSTICLQHICSHHIRYSILMDMYRILKPGGRISLQMGFGTPSPQTVGYFQNNYAAVGTNRTCDTEISTPDEPLGDLEAIGFINFEYWIRSVGPGDLHPNWIFFTATKPD